MTENIPAMRLPNGSVVELPHVPDLAEFQLAGNSSIYPGLVALYDETTKTGAMYVLVDRQWIMRQPIERAQFDATCATFAEIRAAAQREIGALKTRQ